MIYVWIWIFQNINWREIFHIVTYYPISMETINDVTANTYISMLMAMWVGGWSDLFHMSILWWHWTVLGMYIWIDIYNCHINVHVCDSAIFGINLYEQLANEGADFQSSYWRSVHTYRNLSSHWYLDQYFLYWRIERTEIKCVLIP